MLKDYEKSIEIDKKLKIQLYNTIERNKSLTLLIGFLITLFISFFFIVGLVNHSSILLQNTIELSNLINNVTPTLNQLEQFKISEFELLGFSYYIDNFIPSLNYLYESNVNFYEIKEEIIKATNIVDVKNLYLYDLNEDLEALEKSIDSFFMYSLSAIWVVSYFLMFFINFKDKLNIDEENLMFLIFGICIPCLCVVLIGTFKFSITVYVITILISFVVTFFIIRDYKFYNSLIPTKEPIEKIRSKINRIKEKKEMIFNSILIDKDSMQEVMKKLESAKSADERYFYKNIMNEFQYREKELKKRNTEIQNYKNSLENVFNQNQNNLEIENI